MTEDDVRHLVEQRITLYASKRKGSTGFTAWCAEAGINKGHASEFMRGKKGPQTDLLNALGLEYRIEQKRRAK